MPLTKFANLDFDQIRASIKDYLRANSNFTDFDFEGSNFSVLIDTLAYNTYISAFNANMVANESFLDSATLRENVVSLARNIGYLPRSRTAAKTKISFTIPFTGESGTCTLKAGLVCVGSYDNTSYMFSLPADVTTTSPLVNSAGNNNGPRTATFTDVEIYQGTYLTKQFIVDGSLDQRFILNNPHIDTATLKVRVKGPSETGIGREYTVVSNILNVDATSEIYLLQEVQDEKYEVLFGDGIFGKKLENETVVTCSYIVTDGVDGNGPSEFDFAANLKTALDETIIPTSTVTVTSSRNAQGGAEIETLESIKYFAPRLYSSQYRAVTARDYEAIISTIYPDTESVSVVGGEELDPPEFGNVIISIKPKNGSFVSEFNKELILSRLKQYSLAGINQKIIDLKILYVEIDSFVYYNASKVTSATDLKKITLDSITQYANSIDLNKFGGRFKYSKVLSVIDGASDAITSNITRVVIRRDLRSQLNRTAQYELCFGNAFRAVASGKNIKSTGFKILGVAETVYFTDIPNSDLKTGILSVVRQVNDEVLVIKRDAGTIDYQTGEILISSLTITETSKDDGVIEIQAVPLSNDIIGLKDIYLSFDVGNSTINMVKDTISSGDQISGVGFQVTPNYVDGTLTR
ncbi:MAG: baseplate wedge protein [Candidatus Thorarchaeota archaeon]|jgi:hypothetical protein